jgi:hypothetical protein
VVAAVVYAVSVTLMARAISNGTIAELRAAGTGDPD